MNPTILLDRKSNITSQAGSITVFAPTSASFSPYTKDDLNSESYDSILICNDIDIVKEIDKVKSGDDDDDLFKLLSMNFYSNREPPKAPCDRLAPPKSARADREYGVSNKKDPYASSKAKNKLKNTLHENFFDLEKLKKRESPSKQSSMQSDNVKQKPKSPKVPDIKGFAGADGFYFNPLKSSERNSNRKVEPVPKYYSSFLLNKDSSNRDLSNGSRLTNSDVRYISLTRSKDFKETSTALRKNKGKDLTINIKQNRPLTTENKSISPRLQVDILSSRTSEPNRFKSSLREQIINTFSNPLDSSRKNPYLGSPRKNEPSPASSSLVGWRNSFYSNLDSKRMTIEQISCAASIRGSAKKRESEAKKSKASLKTDTSSKGSVSTKREPLKNISEEFSKQKTTTNTQMSERCASPYLFFEMPNQSQNPSFHIAEGSSKEKTKTTTKRIKYSVDDKKGNTSSSKNRKDDSQPKLYFNKEKNGAKNGKGREHDSSYRDSFLSVRV